MKHRKKYLAAAVAALIILVLIPVIHNSLNKKDRAVSDGSTEEESIQAAEENSESEESGTILSAEENLPEKDTAGEETISEEDIKEAIDRLIHTYYESAGKTVEISIKEENPSAENQTGESQAAGRTDEGLTEENQTTDKKQADDQTADSRTAGKKQAEGQTAEGQAAEDKKEGVSNKLSEIIEEYKNITTYIKPGLDKDSYVVFTTYDIKLYNIDTLIPGMSSLSVRREETGVLCINEDTGNEELKNHIDKLTEDEDIQKLIKKVNSELKAAQNKDNSLKEFIDYIK